MSDTPTNLNELAELIYYLPHYYDKQAGRFVPYLYAGMAQSVFLDAENEDNVADALNQLQDAKVFTLAELNAHIRNMSVHASTAELADALAAIGGLIQHTDNGAIHIVAGDKERWESAIAAATAAAGSALTLATGSSEKINQHESRINRLEDGLFNNITGNPFLISFDNLAGITLVKGAWNKEKQRIEC